VPDQSPQERVTTAEAARRAGVTPETLRRWVAGGLVPGAPRRRGRGWPPIAVAHARIVARLRERGHSLKEIKRATDEGRLAFGYVEELLPTDDATIALRTAARETGLEPALIERIYSMLGFARPDRVTEDDVEMLRHMAAVLDAGFPLAAFLQLMRVYGQAIAQMADAEVRLFHLYVHEPLMRDGVPGLEVAEHMNELTALLLPSSSPVMDHLHRRLLHHFIEQDIVGHMEADLGAAGDELGRMRTAIAFADLAGYTQLTEQQGDEEAASTVERFVADVTHTLPDEARIVKTIGDEVMLVSSDPAALADWAVGFQALAAGRPLPRIGIHAGEVLYRDGDYYGREVNLAARVAARAAAGEVLVTRAIVALSEPHQEYERIGEVKLKGFSEPTELFLAIGPDQAT
jgi:adenylate cyclase